MTPTTQCKEIQIQTQEQWTGWIITPKKGLDFNQTIQDNKENFFFKATPTKNVWF